MRDRKFKKRGSNYKAGTLPKIDIPKTPYAFRKKDGNLYPIEQRQKGYETFEEYEKRKEGREKREGKQITLFETIEDTTKEVNQLRDRFKDFRVVDYDNNYIYLKKDGVGAVEGRIIRGSLGSYTYKFVVEKFGERSRLFSGKNAIKRIKKYLNSVD